MTKPKLFLSTILLALLAFPAKACGVWHLEDHERDRTITFYVSSTLIKSGAKSWYAMNADIECPDKFTADIRSKARSGATIKRDGDHIRTSNRQGKQFKVRFINDTLTIGKNVYVINVSERPENDRHKIYQWQVEVKKGEEVVASADRVMSFARFCSSKGRMNPEDMNEFSKKEIAYRTAFYLVYRDLW